PTDLLTNPAADVAAKQRYEQMRREVAALPGVIEVGVGSPMPLRRTDVRLEVKAEGKAPKSGEALPRAELRTANPQFFRAAGIPLLNGRAFAATDVFGAAEVVIVNQTLAERLFANEDPIGKRIAWTGDVLRFTPIRPSWRTIVGIAANTQDGGPESKSQPVVYMPFAQMLAMGGGLVIRADSNVSSLASAATRIIRLIEETAPTENVMTIAQYK